MAITNGYATVAEVTARLGTTVSGVSTFDTELERVITAVSRTIDLVTARRFYASTETRYFTARSARECDVSDLLSVTTLSTDDSGNLTWGTTWAATDYVLMPRNASADGRPYKWLYVSPVGLRSFPTQTDAVKLAGSYGYCATASPPTGIREACVLGSQQVFRRRDATYGVMSSDGFFHQLRHMLLDDPEIMGLLAPYVRHT